LRRITGIACTLLGVDGRGEQANEQALAYGVCRGVSNFLTMTVSRYTHDEWSTADWLY
jgi:hypothetical protein